MPERILFPEFRDEQSTVRYPFSDSASLTSDDGTHVIENDTFIDASLYPIGAQERLHISTIEINPREARIGLSDFTAVEFASVTFNVTSPPELLTLQDQYGRPAGVLVSDPLLLARFSAWETKTHLFSVGNTEFVARCAIPTPEIGVRGFINEVGNLLTDDVWLVGENGVVIRDDGDGRIRIDIVGDPLFVRKLCEPVERFNPPNYIRTINGCVPDKYGNFNITVSDHLNLQTVLRIYSGTDGLVIEVIGEPVGFNNG